MIAHLDPEIWGPHFWGFLHTVAMTYPKHPNAITKKKYYDFVQSIPLFIPVEQMSTDFSKLLEQYPVTPYLDNKESFIRWMWYIHNKVNVVDSDDSDQELDGKQIAQIAQIAQIEEVKEEVKEVVKEATKEKQVKPRKKKVIIEAV